MTANRTEIIAGLILLAFTAFAWNEAAGISGPASFFPRIVIGILGVLSLVYLVRSLFNGSAIEPLFQRGALFAVTLLASIVYVKAVTIVGYATSSFVYIPFLSWVIGFRRPLYMALTTIAYVVSVYVLFEVVFERPLPPEPVLTLIRTAF